MSNGRAQTASAQEPASLTLVSKLLPEWIVLPMAAGVLDLSKNGTPEVI